MTAPESTLDVWERRLELFSCISPYALLATSAVLAWLEPGQAWSDQLVTLGLAALAGLWMLWLVTLHPAWAQRRALMAVYYAGLLVFVALLITRNAWFGLFAFTGYLHAWHFLWGGWRVVGVTASALISATWQTGGLPQATVPAIVSYLVFVTIIVVLVSLFSSVGEITSEQSRQRKRMISELGQANSKLQATLAENQGLHAQVLTQAREAGIQDERQRMAGEIHDTLAQNLTGIITQLEAAEQASRHPDQWRRHLGQARALARESLAEARRSVRALRPELLETVPLPEAIVSMAQRWSESTAVALHVETTGVPQPLLAEIETTVFRVAQEALANVASHANATRVGLTLSYMDDVVLLDVRDDGVGFDVQLLASSHSGGERGFGLRAMEQRLRRVAGTLTIESAPGEGTAINASVPTIPAADRGETI